MGLFARIRTVGRSSGGSRRFGHDDANRIHPVARRTGHCGHRVLLLRIATADGHDCVPQVLRPHGILPVHGDVKPVSLDGHSADQNGPPLGVSTGSTSSPFPNGSLISESLRTPNQLNEHSLRITSYACKRQILAQFEDDAHCLRCQLHCGLHRNDLDDGSRSRRRLARLPERGVPH